jgi:hypothetical protein
MFELGPLDLTESGVEQGRSKGGGGQVGPAHPRIKVKHLLKTKYICNNLKKESNTKALNGMIKIRSLFSDYINFLSQA